MNTKKQTIYINGKTYDMATGKPLSEPSKTIKSHTARQTDTPAKKPRVINDIAPNAQGILAIKAAPKKAFTPPPSRARSVAAHARPPVQKSSTLRRDILKKPVSRVRPNANKVHKHVQKSERIVKFAPVKSDITSQPKKNDLDKDLLAQTRALEKAHAQHIASENMKSAHISSRTIKEHLLGQAMEKVPDLENKSTHQAGHISKKARFTSIMITSFALVMLGGYLTYLNIPNLSIRIAAANTGINAELPSYQPAGYRIHGPISYSDDEINVSYKQASSNLGYKISQRPTDWDPIATLDNYVQSDSKDNYQIHSVQGLTVYTYDKKAVWVNGGILHVLDGNAPLSNQQVERIVASM